MAGDELPEGTDAIETGAGVDARDEGQADAIDDAAAAMTVATAPETARAGETASDAPALSFSARIEGLKGHANDTVREFVTSTKDRATDGIDDVVRLIDDAAAEVDAKIGTQYGDYLRRVGGSVSGLSDTLKAKDVDTLFADGRELITQAPGIAIGVATVVGFVIARLARAGVAQATTDVPPHRA